MSRKSMPRTGPVDGTSKRCAVYTRVSTDNGLDQDFNSLDAQREACEAYIKSQMHEGWRRLPSRYDDGGFSGGSMDRAALQSLIEAIKAGQVDVVVVYKVDRLTRSLADFAKLVEMFDANGVSFVSVTQAFNTTSSMGRLTLNVLLSFAQFEREVTAERIRDKIAASKKKGIWMGGGVPLGYRAEARALHIVEEHATVVRTLYRSYLEVGSVVRLKVALDAEGFRLPIRTSCKGEQIGGGLVSRGHLRTILSNPIYVGRITHRGQTHEGQHTGIVSLDLWMEVQAKLREQAGDARRKPQPTGALLTGKLFDDRGNLMSPSWSKKGGRRYRYYVSKAVMPGKGGGEVGSITRVSANDIEAAVLAAVRRDNRGDDHNDGEAPSLAIAEAEPDSSSAAIAHVSRVDIEAGQVRIVLGSDAPGELASHAKRWTRGDGNLDCLPTAESLLSSTAFGTGTRAVVVPWQKRSPIRRKQILGLPRAETTSIRPMRVEARHVLARSFSQANRWLDELIDNPRIDIAEIARRAGKSERSIRMNLSLAFVSPTLLAAALDGRLPRGIGIKRLFDLPPEWRSQWKAIGLTQPQS